MVEKKLWILNFLSKMQGGRNAADGEMKHRTENLMERDKKVFCCYFIWVKINLGKKYSMSKSEESDEKNKK